MERRKGGKEERRNDGRFGSYEGGRTFSHRKRGEGQIGRKVEKGRREKREGEKAGKRKKGRKKGKKGRREGRKEGRREESKEGRKEGRK